MEISGKKWSLVEDRNGLIFIYLQLWSNGWNINLHWSSLASNLSYPNIHTSDSTISATFPSFVMRTIFARPNCLTITSISLMTGLVIPSGKFQLCTCRDGYCTNFSIRWIPVIEALQLIVMLTICNCYKLFHPKVTISLPMPKGNILLQWLQSWLLTLK